MEEFQIKGIKTKTLKDIIYHNLKDIILNNNFPANDYITEQKLAKMLDVSRTPLREAMQDLVNEELIEFKPRKGYRVRSYTDKEVHQIFLLRKVIESEIIQPMFNNIDDAGITKLKKIVKQQAELAEEEDSYNFMLMDKEFHRQMFLIAEYNVFLKSYDVFHNLTILIGSQAIRKKGRMEEVILEHNDIIAGLEKKDEGMVRNAIEHHLRRTKNMYTDVKKNKEDEE
ncbi:GntR family transcriptional regulator [Salinicoccus roseus]|uniref:GntR family transcriptional regulator n=1 Tax=Salinicoccus roseus TaxID=45670 RepID=UPI001CA6F570|nr:GntR family transcriptional regulator [Salinicoccus roseus]MBY8909805.1 GntR family transcriptional regulator [Salinicoccus roseus]